MITRLILALMFLPACANAIVCRGGYTLQKNDATTEKICDDVSFMIEKNYKSCSFDQLTLLEVRTIKTPSIRGTLYQCSFCYKCEE